MTKTNTIVMMRDQEQETLLLVPGLASVPGSYKNHRGSQLPACLFLKCCCMSVAMVLNLESYVSCLGALKKLKV